MELIDFQYEFNKHVKQWITENMSQCENIDEIENLLPELYMKWIYSPLKILNNLSPELYFQQYKDPKHLIDYMLAYIEADMKIPDLLFDHMTALGKKAEDQLVFMLSFNDQDEKANIRRQQNAKVVIIQLLNEMQAEAPMNDYIQIIASRNHVDEIADAAAQALENLGRKIVDPILQTLYESKNIDAIECFLDIIVNYSGDERVFNFLVTMLTHIHAKKSLYANYLGKYGDERAIPILQKLLNDSDIDYLEYIQIRNAIEELGGNVDFVREFKGDLYYEKLQKNK